MNPLLKNKSSGLISVVRSLVGCLGLLSGCNAQLEAIDLSSAQSPGKSHPSLECSSLDETTCTARSDCEPQYNSGTAPCECPACPPNTACAPCQCSSESTTSFADCKPRPACEGLSQVACENAKECTALFGAIPCAPCGSDPNCVLPTSCTTPHFLACRTTPSSCPPTCDIFCSFGKVLDSNLCPTCACNPPPSCRGLDQSQCQTEPHCLAVFAKDDSDAGPGPRIDAGPRPAADGGNPDAGPCGCKPSENCGCGSTGPATGSQGFIECRDLNDPCSGANENSCRSNPACEPLIKTLECPPQPTDCDGSADPSCQRFPCDPAQIYAGCQLRMDHPSCQTDADCPNGFCANMSTGIGDGGVPIMDGGAFDSGSSDATTTSGQCIFPSCDDDSPVKCTLARPTCPTGQTAALQRGCWSCVDARTCN